MKRKLIPLVVVASLAVTGAAVAGGGGGKVTPPQKTEQSTIMWIWGHISSGLFLNG